MKPMNPKHEPTALRLMSFLLAAVLWTTTLCFRREELKHNVKIEPILPPGMMIVNKLPTQIQFSLSGSRIMLKEATQRIQPIRLDLTRNRQSTVGFSLTEDLLGELPKGVRVTAINPPQVLIRLEEITEKYIPVRATITGKLPAGYEIVSVKTIPSKIAVTGPKGLLDSLDYIGTEALDISGALESREGTVEAEVDPTQGFQLSRTKTVKVRVRVRKVDL